MAHSLTRIGRHLECAIQTEMVAELEFASSDRKEIISSISSISAEIHYKSITQKATKGFS